MDFIDHLYTLYEIVRHQLSYMKLYNTQHAFIGHDTTINMGYTYKAISLDPEWGFEPTLWLLTENVDYKETALPSECIPFT